MKIENIKQLKENKTYFVLETVCENGKDTGIPKGTYTMRFILWVTNRPGSKLTTANIKTKASAGAKEYGTILIADMEGNLIRTHGDTIRSRTFRHIFSTRQAAGEFLQSLIRSRINGWDYHDDQEVKGAYNKNDKA